ncbi:3-oxoacyl-ACP synthase III family protein [Streptomyces sulphureus]|uniref:3-oxoacyl-ACP synthase III family protein n=1 Tax=Streptomyces sulphureus TaxID=47758 RepID=UPI00037AF59F|nr:ketoacyl-ACP synthase III family protein [Streptomyces sulphureus]
MTTQPATLEGVAYHAPERVVAVEELAERLNLTKSKVQLFRKMQGLKELRYDPEMRFEDLVLPAARQVLDEAEVPLSRVTHLIFAHATQLLAPSTVDVAQELRRQLGLTRATAFSLTQQNCASGMAAVDVAGELLRLDGDPDARALVVTGEQAFTAGIQLIPDTAVLGEAAAACLVAVDGAGAPVRSYVTQTLGEYSNGVRIGKERAADLGQIYPEIFADTMRRAVSEAGLTLADIELLIPHNVNMMSWRQTIQALDFPRERTFLENIPRFSHCFASDVFVNYVTLRDEKRLVPGRHYLVASVGVGTTFAAMVITHRED